MKDRVREAIFNLLGPAARGKHVIDLFGGTGAMAFEAISRGSHDAVVIERRFPNVRTIKENAQVLGVADTVAVVAGDAFAWGRRHTAGDDRPLLVFCCPPYDFYVDRTDEVLELLEHLIEQAPPASLLVVECDSRFDVSRLPLAAEWDVRRYPPAVVGVLELTDTDTDTD
jgi:16S rRNA (guanine966-N2)-methyltransferase